jgi:hypothetical protein
VGDVFVIVNEAGYYWSGSVWVDGWGDAVQFSYPGFDPCERAAEGVRSRTGMECYPLYIPPSRESVRRSTVRKERGTAGAGRSGAGVGA